MQLLDQGHHSYISTGFGGNISTPFKVRNLRVTYYIIIIYIYVCIDYISILAANGTKTKALIRIHVVYIYTK